MSWSAALMTATDAYIVVDPAGVIVEWNDAATRMLGYDRSEALGRSAVDLLAPVSDRAEFAAGLVVAGSDPGALHSPVALSALHADGHRFPVECTIWQDNGSVHGLVRDVSERRRRDEATVRLAAIVQGSEDAIISLDSEDVVLTWNPAAERLFGFTEAEAVGRNIELVVADEESERLAEVLRRVTAGEAVSGFETWWLTRDRVRVDVLVVLSPVHDRRGKVVGVSSIVRDIREQRAVAETLKHTLVALQTAVDDAHRSEEAMQLFLADAAHQLRTPVAGIRACAETLLAGASGPDADHLLATMVRETSRAGRLIGHLLQLARLDQGEQPRVEEVDVEAVCAQEVESAAFRVRDGLSITFHSTGSAPVVPLLDAPAVHEIMANLLDNARRHAVLHLGVHLHLTEVGVRVVVLDDGPGVDMADAERIFGRLTTLDGRGGSGLGLTIARALARGMGGDLVYDGAFVLTLPLRPTSR